MSAIEEAEKILKLLDDMIEPDGSILVERPDGSILRLTGCVKRQTSNKTGESQ